MISLKQHENAKINNNNYKKFTTFYVRLAIVKGNENEIRKHPKISF